MKKLIAGNWKMHGTHEGALTLVRDISRGLRGNPRVMEYCDIAVCPPAIHLSQIRPICEEHRIFTGAQDCSAHDSGAYTGEISAPMIRDCGATYVILGHSERRAYHGETSTEVSRKVAMAHKAGLCTIICIGESAQEREEGKAEHIVGIQLVESTPPSCTAMNTVIAYEPIWAIGTGKVAQIEDIASMHNYIRQKLGRRSEALRNARILYGGSLKPENARAIFNIPNVDGGLIGGASLKADQFLSVALGAVKD